MTARLDEITRWASVSSAPTTMPTSRPPAVAQANSPIAGPQAIDPAERPTIATRSSTSDVASLNRDSPSSTVTT